VPFHHSTQPRTLSRILGFPFNVDVSHAALWAASQLRGDPPGITRDDLWGFPRRPDDGWVAPLRARTIAWWSAHADDERYRLR